MSGGSAFSNLRSALSYCVQQVRSYEYQHYIYLHELPLSMQNATITICSFNGAAITAANALEPHQHYHTNLLDI
jgi:hypothetical protein